MDRRSVLALCGGAMTTVAGCGGSSGDTSDRTRSTTATPSPTSTDHDATPLSIRSATAPETVELGQSYTVRFTVVNPTNQEQVLESPVSVRTSSEWRAFTSITARIPPGTTTISRKLAVPRFVGTYRFRLNAPRAEWRIQATERRLVFGESFRSPQGLQVAVLGGRFAESYQPRPNRTVTPPSGQQFLVVLVRIKNPNSESLTFPPLGTFHVQAGGETYDVALDDPTRRLTVEPGSRTRIELPFLVPPSVSAADVTVRWAPSYRQRQTVVTWQTE